MEEIKNKKVLFVIGAIFLLILVMGGTFAYFQIIANNNATSTTISGEGELVGQVTLNTNITQLRLNLTESIMNKDNIGKVYYASETGEGIESSEVTDGNGRYTLATANVTESDVAFDCNYAYVLSATTTNPVEDASDEDLKVVITEANGSKTTYTLKQLLSGVTHTGKMKKVTYGVDQTLGIEAYIENTSEAQNGLSGNEYTITITPKAGTEGFSCDIAKPFNISADLFGKPAASIMTANYTEIEGLWSSGLEGDGLRYVGSGAYNGATTPSNFICFGTTSASECKANEEKYMYRIIGVFPDEQGNQHLKLRKFKQLGLQKWHSPNKDKNWGESTLYTELNGSYFLGNTTYSYLQDDSWSNKIENWKWTAVNTLTHSNSGPNYYNSSTMTPANIYLHEMNRSTKTSIVGEWTYPTGKIGLIYASDYVLSLGDEALAITGSTYDNRAKLKTGWLQYTNDGNSSSAYDWTLARIGANSSYFYAWRVTSAGFVNNYLVANTLGVAPVFYLTSNTTISGGMGTYSEPYVIEQ